MQKSIKYFLITAILLIFTVGFYNYRTDNFAVFNNKYNTVIEETSLPNVAFLKQKHYLNYCNSYENFIFGATNALNISTYSIPKKKCYSFADNSQTLFDVLDLLKLIVSIKEYDKNYSPKSALLFIEPEYLYISENINFNLKNSYVNYIIPNTPSEKVKFYAKYLFKNPFKKEKRRFNYQQKINFFTDGSFVSFQDKNINFECENYFKNFIDLHNNYTTEALAVLNEILSICEKNNIKLTIILTPQSAQKLASFDKNELEKFKKELAKVTDYYDFWTDNEVCGNSDNFINEEFISPQIGEKIIHRIFFEKAPIIKNFGIYQKRNAGEYEK